jgi:hypothetical protein
LGPSVLDVTVSKVTQSRVVDEGGRAVDGLEDGDGDDGCRRAAIGPPPAARSVVQHDHVTGEVKLHPGDTGPPVGNKPAPIS